MADNESKPNNINIELKPLKETRPTISWTQSKERDNYNINNEEFASEPANFDYYAPPYGGEQLSFEAMFKQFKKDSDENLLDLKRSIENKRGGASNKRQ